MDKIYSRKRIKIFYSDKKTIKKKITFTLVIIVATATIISSLKSIDPIFEELCKEKAMQIATDILNTESTKVIKKYEYKDIVTISGDDGGYICRNCYTNQYITDIKTIKLIKMFSLVDISKIKSIKIQDKNKKEINTFLDNYYDRYTGLYLKSKNFLTQIL